MLAGPLGRRTSAIAVSLVALAWLAPQASASPPPITVAITTDCSSDIDLVADIGDTILITLGLACLSLDGVVYNGDAPWPGSTTESGFLGSPTFINAVSSSTSLNYANDWYTLSNGLGTTQVSAVLQGANGAGFALRPGSTIAVVGPDSLAQPFVITYRGERARPTAIWVQGYARTGATEDCLPEWRPSWAQWPNHGSGGWVCSRVIPA